MTSTIVRSGEDGEQAAAGEALKAIHHALVSTQNEVHLIVFEEGLDTIRSKLDNISGTVGVTYEVGLNTELTVAISRVTP